MTGFLILPFLFISDLHCIWAGKCLLIDRWTGVVLSCSTQWFHGQRIETEGRCYPGALDMPFCHISFFFLVRCSKIPLRKIRYLSSDISLKSGISCAGGWLLLLMYGVAGSCLWLEWQFSLHIPAWYDHYLVVFIWMEQSSVFCMCGAITCLMQVTEKISDWSGYPEQQVRFVFVLYFRDSLRFVRNILCFRSGIKFRDFFRQAFSTGKYSGFSCQDWNSWSGSIPFLPIQMCLSVHCISYARVFQLPIYDGRPLSRMSWIIFFGICGIKRFLSGNLSCLSFYTVLSSLSPLFYGQSHVSPRHFALSLLVDNGADHLKPDNIFCASR